MNKPITTKIVNTDVSTGLSRQIWICSLNIDAENSTITIGYKVVLISPTGVVMQVAQSGSFIRTNERFEALRNSAIGVGIKQMIEQMDLSRVDFDLSNFPECLNEGYLTP